MKGDFIRFDLRRHKLLTGKLYVILINALTLSHLLAVGNDVIAQI